MTQNIGEALAVMVRSLVVSHDGDDYVLGRPDLGVYVSVPEPGAVLIEELQDGATLSEATARASAVAGADVDGEDFLHDLSESGLLDTDAAGVADDADDRSTGRRIRWIEGVREQTAKRLFGRVAWTAYILAAALAATVLIARADLRPSFQDFWWLPDPILSMLTLYPLGLVLAALHESWHWLAGRAVGVPAVFRVSYRSAFLVFETDLTQIVAIPRRKRYSPFLAGIAFDFVVLTAVLLLRLSDREGLLALPSPVDSLLAALVLLQILVIAWQFFAVFMRSDIYAVLANALHCHDLYRATWLTTKKRLWRLNDQEANELATISDHDRHVARYFGVAYVAGMLAVLWFLLTYVIPFMIEVIRWVGGNLLDPDPTSWSFWSSLAAVLLVVGQRVVPLLLAIRERRLRRAQILR
ncbi:hypothetical protein [Actinophytocola sp.]|uniref:hypothetical protein n=1 Tax=Actinophytocola sp. TaxID=1872138 RepID=UPI003D6BA8CB